MELRQRSGSQLQLVGAEVELRREGPLVLVALCPQRLGAAVPAFGAGSGPQRALSVLDCLERFTRCEELSGSEAVQCEQCRQKQRALRTINFLQLPQVLIVQLKRATTVGKLKIPVEVPTE